jgi:NTP pyrophosphatase (non-canonical NTP hydrolase)
MTFHEAIELYRDVYKRFEKVEYRQWGINGAMIELSKQVGDLSKWVMIKEQYYAMDGKMPDNINDHIGDELADIFGQLVRIADYYKIDLEEAHIRARDGENACLKGMGV